MTLDDAIESGMIENLVEVLSEKLPEMELNTLCDLRDRILAQIEKTKKAILDKMKQERAELNARLRKIDEALSDAAREKSSVIPKYRNPDNSTQTWSGRGKQPAWVIQFLTNGGNLDEILINPSLLTLSRPALPDIEDGSGSIPGPG